MTLTETLRACPLSDRALAAILGVSYAFVSQMRTGKRAIPPHRLDALADALGLDRDELHKAAARERGYRV